ncbi:MAG: MarR family transcriptional regulator [Deltaproteobacteria bacterium]|nr:MarR family transcriptional regulator [Deltaproteobacteria bacterium]
MPPRSRKPLAAPRVKLRVERRVEESLVLALFDLANHLQRRGERLAAVAGLTTQQWLVLLQIAGDPNFPSSAHDEAHRVLASDIARARGVSRATISAVITSLKKRGLIREDADPADRRRRYLAITRAGADTLEAIEPDRRAANQRLLRGFDQTDRKRMLDYLERCLGVLWDVREDEQLSAARARLARHRS